MKTIRTNCFETNSSSTHSVTIDNTSKVTNIERVKGLKIEPDEFGWEWRRFNDFKTKASYFWTLLCSEYECPASKTLRENMEQIADELELTLVNPGDSYYYVDHGYEHYNNFIKEYPQLETAKGLKKFLLNRAAWIMLGNDNSDGPLNWRMTEDQVRECKKRVILTSHRQYWKVIPSGSKEEQIKNIIIDVLHKYMDDTTSTMSNSYPTIQSMADGVAKIVEQKYDYEKKQYFTTKEYTLNYAIESNE